MFYTSVTGISSRAFRVPCKGTLTLSEAPGLFQLSPHPFILLKLLTRAEGLVTVKVVDILLNKVT